MKNILEQPIHICSKIKNACKFAKKSNIDDGMFCIYHKMMIYRAAAKSLYCREENHEKM